MLLCDVGDAGSLATMARQTRLVLNCVGPVSAGTGGASSFSPSSSSCPGPGELPRRDSAALGTRARSSGTAVHCSAPRASRGALQDRSPR